MLTGNYQDLNSAWYIEVGKAIQTTLMINIISPYPAKLLKPLIQGLKRCLDRSCSCSIKKGQSGDEVNTKKKTMTELQTLYTGDQISSSFVFAQNVAYLLCAMTYSVAMPLMFLMACLFYVVFYWVYKFLLVKYYQKTTAFNAELPISTVDYMRVALIIHLLVALFMVSDMNLMPINNPFNDQNEWFVNHSQNVLWIIMLRIFLRPYCVLFGLFIVAIILFMTFTNACLRILKLLFYPLIVCCGCNNADS